MRGTVEQVTKSKSGKSFRVLIGGSWYGAKFDSKIDAAIGKPIDFTKETDPKFGDWITDWDFDREPDPLPVPTKSATNGKVDRWWAPFTSNCVAHAIAAGVIKEPSQLQAWAKAAKNAIEAADGDLPF